MKISAGVLRRSRAFWCVIAIFLAANLLSVILAGIAPACCDQEVSIGFPFPFHSSGGIAGVAEFYVFGLLLDVVVPPTAAIFIVWIVRLIRGTDDQDE